jgi:hypothetical protein
MLSLLVFIGEAVRDAFDPRKTWRERRSLLLEVRTSPSPSAGRQGRARGARRQLRHQARRDRGAGRRIGLRQVGDGPLRPAAAAYPAASHPTGSIRFQGKELVGASTRDLLSVRGNRISMIFQEPMTSLNPLHTIERQVGEVLILHKGLSREAARASARSNC